MPEQAPADLAALSDLRTPWCIHVIATLRIAERIAEGTTNIVDIAAAARLARASFWSRRSASSR